MRQTQDTAPPDSVPTRRLGVRHAIIGVAAGVAMVWAGLAFVQEAALSRRLSGQAAALREQNALIAAQNQAYRKDIQGITSGSAGEEEARQNGYAKPSEHLYLVNLTPSPSPSPSPSSSPPRPSP
jgi:hypothetical protein